MLVFILLSVGSFSSDHGVSGADTVSVSVEGDAVTLYTGVVKTQQETIKWYFNDILIAYINGDQSKICTDVQCNEDTERFRDRLKLDHQTGSLTITNTRNTHSGVYKLWITSGSSESETIFSVSVHANPGSGPSDSRLYLGVVAVAVLLVVCVASAVGVMGLCRRISRNGMEEKQLRASVESPNKEMENFLQTKIEVT